MERTTLCIRLGLLALLVGAALLAAPRRAVADPGIGNDAAFPVGGAAADTVLEPMAGAPMVGPLAPPPATRITSLIAPPNPPGFGDVQDISYGDEAVLLPPLIIEFSVGLQPGGGVPTGHPASAAPAPPALGLRQEAGAFLPGPFGDGSTMSDVYQSGPLGGPICGPPPNALPNVQILDEDGGPGLFGPRLGVNLPPAALASNLDAYEHSEEAPLVRPLPATGGPPLPATGIIFFTIDPFTAFAWPGGAPIPGPFGPAIPGPSDILAWNPIIGGPVIYATAAMLGLVPGDDVDALAVSFTSGVLLPPGGPGFMGAPAGMDNIVFSLAPASPSLSPTSGGVGATPLAPGCGMPPGTGTAGDLWFVGAPVGPGGAAPYFNAEPLGLATFRSAGVPDDDVDAIDMCNGFVGMDFDGDMVDNGCDFDMDGDGAGNAFDNCAGVPNPGQADFDGDGLGDACDADDDDDGCSDVGEPLLAPPTNPLNRWDFYSVPVPALFAAVDPTVVFRDNAVAVSDAQSVFAYFKKGAKTGTLEYEQDLNVNGDKDGIDYDRSVLGPGVSGPPDGTVAAQDAQLAFAQFKLLYLC